MSIYYDEEAEELSIFGVKYNGFIADDQGCSNCQGPIIYSHDFDATFCPSCNEWKESTCSEPNCDYCQMRPKTPL